jgi:hypothetical protein
MIFKKIFPLFLLLFITAANKRVCGQAFNTPVPAAPLGGQYTSLNIVNGYPAFSYYENASQDLMYVRATNAAGTSWGTPLSIDVTGNVGQYTSLLIVNGNPAITYYDATNGDLKYVRALDASGTTWGTPITIDVLGNVGQFLSTQIVSGNPAISYFDGTNGNLKYVRATDADGSAWATTPSPVDVTGVVGLYTSLQTVNGNPAISYYDNTNGNLKFARATTVTGNGSVWATAVNIDITGDVGQYSSLQVVNGNPAISYNDITNNDLKYISASNASGTAWNTPLSIDVTGVVGRYTSLQIVNGNPAVSYYDATNAHLKYVSATDAAGTAWGTPVTADASGSRGQYNSMIATASGAAIVYYNLSPAPVQPYFISTVDFVLPVMLTDVKAYQQAGGVQVIWRAEHEINIENYEVEHSITGRQFSSIGNITSKGNGSAVINYSFLDEYPISGVNFYRIKIIDRDGKVNYSAVMKVSITGDKKSISVFPNPITGNTISLQLNNLPKGEYTVTISKATGQIVATKKINHNGGSASELVDFSKAVAAGVYHVSVLGEGVNVTEEVIKK